MPELTFYVRIRGKVAGPFDTAGLQKMVRRGMLSRIHEISEDRTTWNSAGEYQELFPARNEAISVGVATGGPEEVDLSPGVGAACFSASDGASGTQYYYAQGGQSVGPVAISVLMALAQNRTLHPDDPVWRQADSAAVAARQVPALAPFYSATLGYAPRTASDRYAGFWRRFGAWIIDTILVLIGSIVVAIGGAFAVGAMMASNNAAGQDIYGAGELVGYFAGIIVPWLYYACYESSSRRATPGKTALGLEVVTETGEQLSFGRATGRHFAKYLSGLILCFGYFMAGWTQRKQALHDLMAGCLVVNK